MHDREDAWNLLGRYTSNPQLIKHALAVEAAMRWYARHFNQPAEQAELWGLTGLLHDFDYEQRPEPAAPGGHPFFGVEILRREGWPEAMCESILGHANYSGVPRTSLMAKSLYAVDELSGLVVAAVLVRPDRSIHTLEPSSVRKRMKDKAFARGCNREDIARGAEELGIELSAHIQNVICGLRERAVDLGLQGSV